jgi:uncharacterized membrane protein
MAKAPVKSRLPYLLRIVRARPRIVIAALIGAAVFAVLPSSWWLATRLLLTWDGGVIAYLAMVYTLMARSGVSDIRRHSAELDEGRLLILVLTITASLASLGAIVAELGTSQGAQRTAFQLALATVTIVLSWFFIHTIFALHYAHEFYGERGDKRGGLIFPGDHAEPDYWDFVYFAFVLGMTFQVSDVAIAARPIRHAATAHGIVSFFFNAALLALVVNIAASAI